MNPTAGSFIVNPRLQRHFWTAAIQFPEQSSLFTIFSAFLNKHFSKFKSTIQDLVAGMIKATFNVHQEVERNFRKTAVNFYYEFNVRHLTNVFQGLLGARLEAIKEPDNLCRLWVHECERIYGDRLVNADHLKTYREFAADITKKAFPRQNMAKYFQLKDPEILVFANFVASLDEKLYDQFPNLDALSARLREALREYNDTNAVMDLVLFDDAMKHVCKISRIIGSGGGHALNVGVGGSGKQSLSKLSSFICSHTPMTIMISSSYGVNDLKEDLKKMYRKAGMKDEGIMFLFTEGQITNERFLVFINDLLSSGEINDLFPVEDIDEIVNGVRSAVKSEGIVDNKDNCIKFFYDRVRNNLHMALCFSPVGDSFRNRARKFPAIINNTTIDCFHDWPQDALLSVASKFLDEVEMASDEIRQAVVNFMPFSFKTVNEYSRLILEQERRYVYTTPKSFLELIMLFKSMLGKKKDALEEAKQKYEVGVVKINDTAEVVAKLEETLKVKSVEVDELKKVASEQAEVVGKEKEIVDAEAALANVESEKCAKIAAEVAAESAKVQAELDAAIPLVQQAQAALDVLSTDDIKLAKSFSNPPKWVKITFEAVLHLLCNVNPDIKVNKKGQLAEEEGKRWAKCQNIMNNPGAFIDQLKGYQAVIDKGQDLSVNFKAIRETLADENFNEENVKKSAVAAGGVCVWVTNITMYYDVFVEVEPKKAAVAKMAAALEEANAKKEEMENKVADLTAKLNVLQAEFDKVMKTKQDAEDEAAACFRKLDLAQRLVNALGSESERWAASIIRLGDEIDVVLGDVLLASSFVSYVGPFNKKFRDMIIENGFVKFFKDNGIPHSPEAAPLKILTTDAEVATWNNQKLPSDKVSAENGAILTNSDRYSLIIDPQLQGITWLREKEKESDLQVTRLANPKMVKTLELSIETGKPVLIENLQNSIDAVIQPVYARAIIKKGKSQYIKMGDKELSLHKNFRFYLHTKLGNPHYPPEIQAECALINFTVTEAGLEDQLLTLVVKKERPDLAAQSEELIQQQNQFKITLAELEADLLQRLNDQEGDILEDLPLIENLEKSKKISTEIQEKVEIAKVTEVQIKEASEVYRPAANRGALVFFLLNELNKVHEFYKFSLGAFIIVIERAIDIVAE